MPQLNQLTLPEKVIQQIIVSSTGLEKAAAELTAQRKTRAKMAELIPRVCDVMVQHERILPSQREKLAKLLEDPAEILQILIKVAGHRNNEELGRLGSGVSADGQVKQASASTPAYNSLTSPYVGQRTTQVKQSSVNLFQRLGLQVPTVE